MQKLMLTVAAVLFGLSTVADELPVTDGLTVWLDASDEANVVLNEDGQVTTWINRAPNGYDFVSEGIASGCVAPYWSSTGLSGKGAVIFGHLPDGANAYTELATKSGEKVKSQSIFIVTAMLSTGVHTKEGRIYGNYSASDAILKETAATTYKWYKSGWGGQAWYNGVKKIDVANGLNPNNFEVAKDVAHVVTAVRSTALNDRTQVGYGSSNHCWCGPIAEVIAFDRKLLPYERIAIENYLMAKWCGASKRVWNGGEGLWSEASNWTPNGVPEESDLVDIPSGSVTVEGTAAVAKSVTVEGNLTLAQNAWLSFDRGGFGKNSVLTLNDGSNLDVAYEFSCDSAGSQTFAYNGTVSVGSGWYGLFMLPSTVLANGRLIKHGTGRLTFTANGPTTGRYDIAAPCSAVDFAGKRLLFSSLEGASFATNLAAATTAELEFDVTDRGKLETALPSTVSVVKKGQGTLSVRGGSLMNVGAEVQTGTLAAGDQRLPVVRGAVAHVDASDSYGYALAADGRVTAVHSRTGFNGDFVRQDYPKIGHMRIKADAINGRPGLACGSCAKACGDASNITTYQTTRSVKVRTVVAVVQTAGDIGYSSTAVLLGKWTGKEACALAIEQSTNWKLGYFCAYGSNLAHGLCSVNGKVVYDYDAGLTDKTTVYADPGKPQLLVMTASDSGTVAHAFDIGSNNDGVSYAWNGYIGELIVFDRVLETSERQQIEAELMAKWGIASAAEEPAAVHETLSPLKSLAMASGTTLDLNGLTQTVEKVVAEGAFSVTNGALAAETLEVACAADGTWGAIDGDANWDVTETTLCFSGLGEGVKPAHGKLVTTTGACVGPFAAVDGFDPKQVKVKSHYIRLGLPGLLLLFR